LPVLEGGRNVGCVSEVTLVKLLHDGVDLTRQAVRDVMARPLPEIEDRVDVGEAYRLLLAGHGGVVVTRKGAAIGFLARIDLVNYWTHRQEAANG
jgi:predicted transcriptional regulator